MGKYRVDVPVLYLYTDCMGTIRDARRVLADAEGHLRQLIEDGLKEQRYSDVAEIAGLAQGVARLLQGHTATANAEAAAAQSSTPYPPQAAPVRKAAGKPAKADYPRFERDGNKLVKVGWSKKNKSAYEHRAPKEAVIAFARHLSGSVPDGKLFVVEDLLPVPDVANGGELPAYQVYLALAWLRSTGAVDKKGRDGYVLRRGALGDGALERLWAGLPARSA